MYVNYDSDNERMARDTAAAIEVAATYLHQDFMQDHLEEQQKFYKRFYNWTKKGLEWESFLRGALNARK